MWRGSAHPPPRVLLRLTAHTALQVVQGVLGRRSATCQVVLDGAAEAPVLVQQQVVAATVKETAQARKCSG